MPQAQTEPIAREREYETIYVLRSTVEPSAAEKIASRVEEVIGREGGKLTRVETWGRRLLAYPVRKQKRGVYVYLNYMGGGPVVSELERNLRMLDDVIKFQTVQLRADVDPSSLSIDPEAVKFEPIQPAAEDEEDESLERVLGLEEPSASGSESGEGSGRGRDRGRDASYDDSDEDSADDSDDSDDSDEEEEE